MLAEGLAEPVIHPLDMEVATPREYAALAEGLERDFGRLDGIVHAAVSFGGLDADQHAQARCLAARDARQRQRAIRADPGLPATADPGQRQRGGVRAGRSRTAAACALGRLRRIEGGAGAVRRDPARGNRQRPAACPCDAARRRCARRCGSMAYFGEDSMQRADAGATADACDLPAQCAGRGGTWCGTGFAGAIESDAGSTA